MRCPRCHGTLPFFLCPECKGEVPEESLFCCRCGTHIKKEKEETDFSERTPCSDGTCIGTINEEGVCNVCKKAYTGGP